MIDINNLNPIIKTLLSKIGVNSKADVFDFFYQDIYSLFNPFEIKDIDALISRIKEAIDNNEYILVYGDKDADGVTAASIVYNTIRAITDKVYAYVPSQDIGYGLSKVIIEEYASQGVSLIITVDCGISNVEEVAFARNLGIDIVVSDHHDLPETLPDAYLLFNPKIKDSGFNGCYYSGASVAFKLMTGLVFSYSKFYNKDIIILDYEVDKESNSIKNIKALRLKNFLADSEIFAFEKTKDGYKAMYIDYYEDFISEEEVLEELASYMFEGESVSLVLTGGEERLKKLLYIYERYEIELPAYEEVFNLLDLAVCYGNINLKETKTLKDFALSLNINIYRYEGLSFSDMLIKAAVFQRLFLLSQKKIMDFVKRESILACISTVADIIPLLGESRVIVKTGLDELNKTPHIRYQTLIEKVRQNKEAKIDSMFLGWKISPFINAAGRMGMPDKALKFLIATDTTEMISLCNEIWSLNEERKLRTGDNVSTITGIIEESANFESKSIIVVRSDAIDIGLTGLIASNIMSKYSKPAIVVACNNEDNNCVGSARSRGDDNVRDMLEYTKESLTQFGGHKNAAGFSLNLDNYENFKNKVEEYATKKTFGLNKEEKKYSMKLNFSDITLTLAENLELFEPYGTSNEEPIFATYNVSIKSIKRIGNNRHVSISLFDSGKMFNAVIWDVNDMDYLKMSESKNIDIIYKIKVDRFKTNSSEVKLFISSYELR